MKILVTGGAGFLGSHLCDRLLKDGHHVTCVDNLTTGVKENLPYHHNFTFRWRDVISLGYLEVDQIYNLACPASPVHYQENPVWTMKTNVMGADAMLEIAKRTGARVLQASTSEVYGDPLQHPQTEDYWGNVNPIGPRACYDEGKRAAETLFFDYQRMYGTDIRVARIFNTYGPRMRPDDGRVVSNFVCQALKGDPITIYGDGSQTRSFCYVDDMVDGLIKLMNSQKNYPVNLGNPTEFTVKDLAIMVKAITGSESEIIYKDLPVDDPTQRKPDISRAKELGWSPQVDLATGLLRTIEWFKELT